jgi:caffeoyl-CoA O-methyltransferase
VYYEEILARLRPNAVLLVDNVLWDGRVVRSDADDDNTKAIRAFNDMVAADDRVEAVMLPIADGLTLCRKK